VLNVVLNKESDRSHPHSPLHVMYTRTMVYSTMLK